jgi:hypothetical protein
MAGFPDPRFERVSVSLLDENPWNPNKMTDFMYAKAKESLTEFGFIAPVVVQCNGARYQIIDGAHRYRAAVDLGFKDVPVVIVDGLSPDDARKLTVVLNELHGQADPRKLSDLLGGLLGGSSVDEVLHALPFTSDILKGFVGLGEISFPDEPKAERPARQSEDWSERTFRLPSSVNEIVTEALLRAKDGDPIEDWQALERICADFLANT